MRRMRWVEVSTTFPAAAGARQAADAGGLRVRAPPSTAADALGAARGGRLVAGCAKGAPAAEWLIEDNHFVFS